MNDSSNTLYNQLLYKRNLLYEIGVKSNESSLLEGIDYDESSTDLLNESPVIRVVMSNLRR